MRPILRLRRILLLPTILSILVFGAGPSYAAPPPLKLDARSAVLLDFTTGQVLLEQNGDSPAIPASLTKLVTLHLAYKALAEGKVKPEDRVQIREEAWAAKLPGSSVMFLEPGQVVTFAEIMKGIAIPSGNDASIAMAQHLAGTVQNFAAEMNKEMAALGFSTMQFVDPHGLSSRNQVTAREFAEFARIYVQKNPQALTELHSVREFRYPLWENLSPQARTGVTRERHQPILQYNRNGLLDDEGVDGLKTGFVDQSGYNIALTAKRGEMRLVAVIMGVGIGESEAAGSRKREAAGRELLNWGFQNFITFKPPVPAAKPVRVWKGSVNQLALEPATAPILTLERGQETRLTQTVHQETDTVAPVKKGAKLGEIIYAADGKEIARVPLVAAADLPQGGLFKRIWDSIQMTVISWFKK